MPINPVGGTIDPQIINDNLSYLDSQIQQGLIGMEGINGLTEDNVNIYVDAVNGSDSGDGTVLAPYKTLQRAVDSIPKVINRDRFIYVADGTYDEEVVVKSIIGGAIHFYRKDGQVEATSATGINVRSIVFYDVIGYCRVENFSPINASSITSAGFIRFSRCAYGTVHKCRATDGNITVPSFVWDGTNGSVNSNYFNNQRKCIQVMNGSDVRVDSSNTHGATKSDVTISAQAATININGAGAWLSGSATVEQEVLQGGRIRQQAVSPLTLTVSGGGWVEYDSGNYKPRAVKDESGVVHLQGIIKNGTAAQGTIVIQLPVGYRPIHNNHIFGTFVSDGSISKVLVDISGALAVESASGAYVSLAGISFYAGW
jgi:hypothetical protein